MDTHLPPEAWRSEAFHEDLSDDQPPAPPTPARKWGGIVPTLLLGMLPVALAAAGALAAVWSGA